MQRSLIILFFLFLSIYTINSTDETDEIQIDPLEKDKLLACGEIVSKKYQLDQKPIDEVLSLYQDQKDRIMGKISGDLLTSCYNKIEDNEVKSIFNNLEFVDFYWTDDYNKFFKDDYSKYRTGEELDLTPEQHYIFYKLDKVKTEYMTAQRQRQEKAAKSFPKILGIDIMNVSSSVKLLYTFIVFAFIAVGILYGLAQVQKKKVSPRKPKKNN